MENYVVYKHTCLVNRKVYIGITNNTERRFRLKGIEYRPPKNARQNGRRFWNAIQKYNWHNFETEILDSNISFETALELEKSYIKLFDSTNKEKGYNISEGGNGGRIYKEHPKGMLGKSHSKEFKEYFTDWISKKENNCMTNGTVIWGETHEHPKGMLGKKHSEEHKERLRQKTGYKASFRKEVKCIMPNGEIINFPTKKSCATHLGLNSDSSIINKCLKTGEPYKLARGTNGDLSFYKSLEGLKLEYI